MAEQKTFEALENLGSGNRDNYLYIGTGTTIGIISVSVLCPLLSQRKRLSYRNEKEELPAQTFYCGMIAQRPPPATKTKAAAEKEGSAPALWARGGVWRPPDRQIGRILTYPASLRPLLLSLARRETENYERLACARGSTRIRVR
ncbi:hypothetical protein EVAR_102211_1 [Eumeta japonica]|uniref:Uncharacterized protein n=1 Tax=Eumeta variegata TaxID=151549 RepID=A0A4C1WD06_EUMVA|nr:hypothetical protein EVAR_102211_1 [Eumeta japonica]